MTSEQKSVLSAVKLMLQDRNKPNISSEDISILVDIINEATEHEEWHRIKKAVESDVERLEHKVVSLKKGIKHMMMNCGMPDAGDACRAVIATGKKLLDERMRV